MRIEGQIKKLLQQAILLREITHRETQNKEKSSPRKNNNKQTPTSLTIQLEKLQNIPKKRKKILPKEENTAQNKSATGHKRNKTILEVK